MCWSFTAQAQLPSGFVEEQVGEDWEAAVGLTFSKDGNRMYVWEKGGKVWIVDNGQKLQTPLIDISEEVGDWGDHGLLGFAIDPNFATNGYIYLLYVVDRHHLLHFGTGSYSASANAYNEATIGRLTRYTVTAANNRTAVDRNSRKILLGETAATGVPVLYVSHGVGSLVFGEDGSLLVSTGDGASAGGVDYGVVTGDTNPNRAQDSYALQALQDGIITEKENIGALRAQQINSMSGKILRLDPATGRGLPSNPYYDAANPASAASRVWALGLRNPFRFTVKPGSGSATTPGVLYIGDTGWNAFEEINVAPRAGMNFGWPLYEGLERMTAYHDSRRHYNTWAPNPLFGQGNCQEEFATYQDLLKQPRRTEQPYFYNFCNFNQALPDELNKFVHARPVLEWANGSGGARTGTFTGEDAATIAIGAAGSPVSGPQFNGSSSTGGIWYTGTDFPAEYRNTYFFGDYGAAWIRNASFSNADAPVTVRNFKNNNAVVVAFATNPVSGGLYYIHYAKLVKKISYYSGNVPPKAVASADKLFGASPLTVQFTGNASSDPDGDALTYEWDFGDGTAKSTVANPSHVFTTTEVGKQYTVTLKVTDTGGLSNTATLLISANNTPPVVAITSPAAGSKYSISAQTTYNLRATVTDAEHSANQLTYQWQTVLHHNKHTHPEPIDNKRETTTTIEPIGCDGETYFYRIHLTVTDAGGLSTTTYVDVEPNCQNGIEYAVSVTTPGNVSTFAAGQPVPLQVSFTNSSRTWAKVGYYRGKVLIGESTTAPFSFSWQGATPGEHSITARAIDTEEHDVTSLPITLTITGSMPGLENCLPGLQHYFGLNESAAGSYTDYVTSATATCSTCPTEVVGKFLRAQRFDNNSKVNLNNPVNFNWARDASFTIEMWIRTSANPGANSVIFGRNVGSNGLHWWVGLNGQGQVVFHLLDANHVGPAYSASGPALNDGNWHHVVAVREEATNLNKVYVDGVLTEQKEYTYAGNFVAQGEAPVTIGYMDRDGGFNYSGDIDELKVYSRAITAAEVTGNYSNGSGAYCGPVPLSVKGNLAFTGAFEVYPNPTTSGSKIALYVSSLSHNETVTIALYDITGKKVVEKRKVTNPDGSLADEIELSRKISPGLYNIVLTTSNRSISRKLMVVE